MYRYTWTDRDLEPWRSVGDPLADGVIREIYDDARSVTAVNNLLNLMVRHDVAPPDELPPAARRDFQISSELPPWVDEAAIAKGEEVFMRYGLLSLTSLICASLPACYAMRNGVQVLGITQQLGAHTYRRIYETAQMVIDVMARGGLAPGGRGVRSAQKVRLMHAAMRYLLTVDPDEIDATVRGERSLAGAMARKVWDPSWGLPINQEDMAFTLQTFSTVMLAAWERLGVGLDPAERDAYYHCWRVVGHLLGVNEALNPPRLEAGQALFEAVRSHQQGSTGQGQALTRALAETVEKTLDFPFAGEAVTLLTRHLAGDATADLLGVPDSSTIGSIAMGGLTLMVRATSVLKEGVGDEIPVVHRISAWVGQKLVERITQLDRGGARLFHLPTELRDEWGA
jgi:hypothetical protein